VVWTCDLDYVMDYVMEFVDYVYIWWSDLNLNYICAVVRFGFELYLWMYICAVVRFDTYVYFFFFENTL
jgi:hypothetical protein